MSRRETRLAKIQEAKKALEEQALAAAQAQEARRQVEDDGHRAGGETPRPRAPIDPTPEPLPPLRWVFAGSLTLPDGRFAADIEGTVACLVDFESALVALDTSHSADNDQLWLAANTKEIPPRGTKCTLLIRSDHRPTVEVDLVDEHTVRFKDQSLSAEQLAKMLRPPPDDPRPGRLYIHPAATVSDEAAKAFTEKVTKSGFDGPIKTKRRP